jgi:hypothetical protein
MMHMASLRLDFDLGVASKLFFPNIISFKKCRVTNYGTLKITMFAYDANSLPAFKVAST